MFEKMNIIDEELIREAQLCGIETFGGLVLQPNIRAFANRITAEQDKRIAELEKQLTRYHEMYDRRIKDCAELDKEKEVWRDYAIQLREALKDSVLMINRLKKHANITDNAGYTTDGRMLSLRDVETATAEVLALPMPDSADAVPNTEAVPVYRKAFICKSCEGVYADNPVSQCDCMPSKQEFTEAVIVTNEAEIRKRALMDAAEICEEYGNSCREEESVARYLAGVIRKRAQGEVK